MPIIDIDPVKDPKDEHGIVIPRNNLITNQGNEIQDRNQEGSESLPALQKGNATALAENLQQRYAAKLERMKNLREIYTKLELM